MYMAMQQSGNKVPVYTAMRQSGVRSYRMYLAMQHGGNNVVVYIARQQQVEAGIFLCY